MGNGGFVAWDVQILPQKGWRKLTVTMEMSCGEPPPPIWKIIFDAIADGLAIAAVSAIAVGVVLTIAPALAVKIAADPDTAEQMKKFTEELLKLR
jgi:hypothetical protein